MKLLGEWNKVKGVKSMKGLMKLVSMHAGSRTMDSMAIFPMTREHYVWRIVRRMHL